MKVELAYDHTRTVLKTVGNVTKKVREVVPKGTIIDHPDAHKLVRTLGAKPLDAETRFAAGLNDQQIESAGKRFLEVSAGIHPEDLALFREKKITGYRGEYDPDTELPSMQYVRGPNWTDADTAAIDGDEEEDEETATDQQAG